MNTRTFDVIVVGGGHAGIEAAYAAAKMGCKTALITLSTDTIGLMPCNPSIGGLGKGHIVYEVSALGGLMPHVCSSTYLQSRMLNTSKGPAVQGLRLQIDKYAYSKTIQRTLANTANLSLIESMVTGFMIDQTDGTKSIGGVVTHGGTQYTSDTVVVTSGTFLNGLIHIGDHQHPGGRRDEDAVVGLTDAIEDIMGITMGRLKTGTPPRLLRDSIDFTQLEYQQSDTLPYLFEFTPVHTQEKMPVYIATTNPSTHAIIEQNMQRSAMYSGTIKGIGPRYCPSIEDKINRFPGRQAHHIFVEPEGAESEEVYPSGLSTSLPLDVQHEYIHSIRGFEHAIITKAGYAVEYDFVQPRTLTHSLEVKTVRGLFFAGQINGTTGYEEAAGQGIIAGINAALRYKKQPPFILDRHESYIGVMIDDLITLGVDEPYRMFTSRAERRLILRQDNAFSRIMPYGYRLGLITQSHYEEFLKEQDSIARGTAHVLKSGPHSTLYKAFQTVTFDSAHAHHAEKLLTKELGEPGSLSSRALLSIHATLRYHGYLEREKREIEKMRMFQDLVIPEDICYDRMPGLCTELRQKLVTYHPETIAQAQRIPGMTPAAISLLIFQVRRRQKR